MEKIIIHLEIPSLEKEFDMYIPIYITIYELTRLLVKAIEEISENHYVSSGHEMLCLKEKNLTLMQELAVETYGIQNGDHLVLL